MFQYIVFLAIYVVISVLTFQSAVRVQRGRFNLVPVMTIASGVAPAITLWVLTGQLNLPFALLSCAYVIVTLTIYGVSLRLFPPKNWYRYANSRLGIEPAARGALMVVIGFGLLIVMLVGIAVFVGYPILIGYWHFTDPDNAALLIISTTLAQIALSYLLNYTILSIRLVQRSAPERHRSILFGTRIVEILLVGPLVAFFLVSIQGPEFAISNPAFTSTVIAMFVAALMISVVPYLIGWSRGRQLTLDHLNERAEIYRKAIAALETGAAGSFETATDSALEAIDSATNRYSENEAIALAWTLAKQIRAERPGDVDLDTVQQAVTDLVQDMLDEPDLTDERRDFLAAVAYHERTRYIMASTVMTMLTERPAFPEDEQRTWLEDTRQRTALIFSDIKDLPDGPQRGPVARQDAALLRTELDKVVERQQRVAKRAVPGVAVVGTLALAVFSTGFQELGTWIWNLATGFLDL